MPETDTQLLGYLDRRDMKGAATCLVTRHADEVFGLCRAMTRDEIIAEDLSQDVFSRAFTALASFRGEASSRTWILRIARNRCIDHLRSVSREPWGDDDTDIEAETPEPQVDDLMTRRDDVKRGLEALTEGERALVMLRFGHGLEYGELAETFGLREGTARMRVSRAVSKMRAAVTPMLGSAESIPITRAPRPLGAPAPAAPLASGAVPVPSAPPPLAAPPAPARRSRAAPSSAMAGSRGAGALTGYGSSGAGSGSVGGPPSTPFGSTAPANLTDRLRAMTSRL